MLTAQADPAEREPDCGIGTIWLKGPTPPRRFADRQQDGRVEQPTELPSLGSGMAQQGHGRHAQWSSDRWTAFAPGGSWMMAVV